MPTAPLHPLIRLRRLRYQKPLRDLVRQTHVSVNDLLLPLFICHGEGIKQPIHSMPEHYQLSLDQLAAEINAISALQIPGVLLFGIPANKDASGSESFSETGIIQQAIQRIKAVNPALLVVCDCCFCEYTDHGHCGIVDDHQGVNDVNNDVTLALLQRQAVSQAKAGADVIAPSGMLDGMVAAVRQGLDQAGYSHVPILSYAVKYASALYGPFREAAQGAPQFGDRKTYQMDYANATEALREAELDVAEGADMLMVKPGLLYLDIIYRVKQAFPSLPLAAYCVSGEYAMLKAAGANGWLDETQVALEMHYALKRAGADIIISYAAKEIAKLLGM